MTEKPCRKLEAIVRASALDGTGRLCPDHSEIFTKKGERKIFFIDIIIWFSSKRGEGWRVYAMAPA